MKDAIGQDLRVGDWVTYVSGMNGGSMAFGRVVLVMRNKRCVVVEAPRRHHAPLPALRLCRMQKAPRKVIRVPRVPVSLQWLWTPLE